MRLRRDLSGRELAQLPRRYGYEVTHETGSHRRLTTQQGGEHHATISDHKQLRVGTLASILTKIAEHRRTDRDKLAKELFER